MLLKKLEYILCFAAGLIITVVNLVVGRDLTTVLFHLLIVFVAFYIFGVIVRVILQKKVFYTAPQVEFAIENEQVVDNEVSDFASQTEHDLEMSDDFD
ncbi:MAG: hypothetical protein FWE44_01690 [Defluviitaleaceae bacterium]|nr:hypothetical protein [Defluviitaleaceae bacterium]